MDEFLHLGLSRSAQRIRRLEAHGDSFQPQEVVIRLLRSIRAIPIKKDRGTALYLPLLYCVHYSADALTREKHLLAEVAPEASASNLYQSLHRVFHKALLRWSGIPSDRAWAFWRPLTDVGRPARGRQSAQACHRGTETHPLFEYIDNPVPARLKGIQGLVRIDLAPDWLAPGGRLVVIVGAGIEPVSRRTLHQHLEVFGQTLAMELDRHLHVRSLVPKTPSPPTTTRAALDTAHDRLVELAVRSGARGWEKDHRGLSFLAAFRELDHPGHSGQLRYKLTHRNISAMRSRFNERRDFDHKLKLAAQRVSRALVAISERESPTDTVDKRQRRSEIRDRIKDAQRELVGCYQGEYWERLRDIAESEPYPLAQTPGSVVMEHDSPEIIEDWMGDPRASSQLAATYPIKLLLWEAMCLPNPIYYSPIYHGEMCIGICGVDAALLRACNGDELQFFIDSMAVDVRERLVSEGLDRMREAMFNARNEGVSGESLLEEVLYHFRSLAFYAMPVGPDYKTDTYFTKVVLQSDLATVEVAWSDAAPTYLRRALEPLYEGQWAAIAALKHRMGQVGQTKVSPLDFLAYYVQNKTPSRGSHLFQITVSGAPAHALLVLVPSAHHGHCATEYLRQFFSICNSAYGEPTLRSRLHEIGHYWDHLSRFWEALVSRDAMPRDELRIISEIVTASHALFNRDLAQKPKQLMSGADLAGIISSVTGVLEEALAGKSLIDGIGQLEVKRIRNAVTAMRVDATFRVSVSREAALLLFWDLLLNACRHSKTAVQIKMERVHSESRVVITNDRREPARVGLKRGVTNTQRLAAAIGCRVDTSSRLRKDRFEFITIVTF